MSTPTFDLNSLKAAKSDETITRKAKGSRLDKYPQFVDAVQKSKESGQTMQYQLPNADAAKQVVGLLRDAAKKLGLGLSVRQTDDHKVLFQGKDKRSYTPAV